MTEPEAGDSWFKGCISIPNITLSGTIGVKYRVIDGSTPKFRKAHGEQNLLFNTRALKSSTHVVVTEGEMDTMAATVAGFDAIAIPGAQNWKEAWTRIFRNRKVAILVDGDDAGRQFADHVSGKLDNCIQVAMPDGEDANSMLVKEGPQWLRDRVRGRV